MEVAPDQLEDDHATDSDHGETHTVSEDLDEHVPVPEEFYTDSGSVPQSELEGDRPGGSTGTSTVEEQDYLLDLLILQDISFSHLLQFLEDVILQGLLLEDVRVQYEAHLLVLEERPFAQRLPFPVKGVEGINSLFTLFHCR